MSSPFAPAMRLHPNVSFARNCPVDLAAAGIEEALADDGLFLLMEDDPTPPARTVRLATIDPTWTGIWDSQAQPELGWPDGDPATSLAQGLSAATDAVVLSLYSTDSVWGYLLHRAGLLVDRFATDPRQLADDFDLDLADPDGLFRGDPGCVRALLEPGHADEELVESLSSGDEALLAFLALLGLPTSITLDAASLTPVERDLMLALRFAERL